MYSEIIGDVATRIGINDTNVVYPIVLMFFDYKINGKYVRFYNKNKEIKKYKVKQNGDNQFLIQHKDSTIFFTGSEIVVCETKSEIKGS